MVHLAARTNLQRQIDQSVQAGARLVLGGVTPEGVGAFYPTTVLADVTAGMAAHDEELFGPAVSIILAKVYTLLTINNAKKKSAT
jgi:succinate-semialdehyde dehydrogenase/glutarate-semialdehyde dehydrogenase